MIKICFSKSNYISGMANIKFLFAVLVPICFLFKTSQAQPNLLGKSEESIIAGMKKITSMTMISNIPDFNGVGVIGYVDDELTNMVYFFKDHKCTSLRVVMDNKYLNEAVKQLNEDNVRVDDITWTAKNLKYKVSVVTATLTKGTFWLVYEPI
jgi:hypothetical protein